MFGSGSGMGYDLFGSFMGTGNIGYYLMLRNIDSDDAEQLLGVDDNEETDRKNDPRLR